MSLTKQPSGRAADGTILYLNVPRLLARGVRGASFTGPWEQVEFLHDLEMRLHQVIDQFRPMLSHLEGQAVDYTSIRREDDVQPGALVAVSDSFRTRDIPGLADLRSGRYASLIEKKEPIVYSERERPRLVIRIDPRFVTFSSAFVVFRSGRARLAGVSEVNRVEADTIHTSGLFVALPQ